MQYNEKNNHPFILTSFKSFIGQFVRTPPPHPTQQTFWYIMHCNGDYKK